VGASSARETKSTGADEASCTPAGVSDLDGAGGGGLVPMGFVNRLWLRT